MKHYTVAAMFYLFLSLPFLALAAEPASTGAVGPTFPRPLESYNDAHLTGVWDVLRHRVQQEPLNLWVTLLFAGAVVHTFFTARFVKWSHQAPPRSSAAGILHFLGEVEAVFGIWVLPLVALLVFKVGWTTTQHYLEDGVSYHEPMFVVIVMAMASTKPILHLAEQCLRFFARLGGGGPGAWWLAILTIGPMLGSVITEPAAMTISALLLARQFYELKPAPQLAYATLGLLFVNISVGGVLTHFAAPPVLMVAGPWHWNTSFMFRHFGWIAMTGIAIATLGYYLAFRRQFAALRPQAEAETAPESMPVGVTIGNVLFMAWSVLNAHHPILLIGGFLFFLAYIEVTSENQLVLHLRSPLLVGFFLAGLVIHGGLQQWWIAPVLGRLREVPLMLSAVGLTAFNDNAAITYLSTLVPTLNDAMRFAVVAGAVTGGGLTVIANAPNPAGQSVLAHFFSNGISPLGLLLGALPATVVMLACFLLLR
jgi:hypothetical protein